MHDGGDVYFKEQIYLLPEHQTYQKAARVLKIDYDATLSSGFFLNTILENPHICA